MVVEAVSIVGMAAEKSEWAVDFALVAAVEMVVVAFDGVAFAEPIVE